MAEILLQPKLLVSAYARGYFPMPDPETGEIVWMRPDPRAILPLDGFRASRSLMRSIRKEPWRITRDQAFREVMEGCAARPETWITREFLDGYTALHQQGVAHSLEVWRDNALVGGTYGVALGGAFFAESKFHRISNASKVALYHLVKHLRESGFKLLEVQFLTPHLESLGVIEVADEEYQKKLTKALLTDATY